MTSEPTVFIVDDDEALCEALRWLIEGDGLAVETHTSARSFLDGYDPERPGCLLLDVRMQGMSGLELHDRLRKQNRPPLPVIILTGHGDVPMAVGSLKSGAFDFLQKPVHDEVLVKRIREAIRLDRTQRRQRGEVAAIHGRIKRLTPRERQVMELIVAGKSNKAIAGELRVSEKTIEVHRKRIMKKMEAHSAAELAGSVTASRLPPT